MSDDRGTNPLKPGDHFGDYVVEKLLGKGGMGAVYLVRATSGLQLAVKVLYSHKMTHELRRRFAEEAHFANTIRHRNLIPVYDFGQDPDTGLCYIIMEYVSGGSLADMIKKRGRIPLDEAVDIIIQIAAALEVVHRNGVVHRDIKPGNIMFTANGRPVLADLGVAKFTDGIMTTMTMTGMIVGTPAYMSPEQLMDSHKIDVRSDIYSLGVVLYEMLAGKRPNEGCTTIELLAKAFKGEPLPNIRTECPEVPLPIAHVLSCMCAPQPGERPATALAAAVRLKKAATGRFTVRIKCPEFKGDVASKNRRISGLTVLMTGLIAVGCISAITVWMSRSSDGPRDQTEEDGVVEPSAGVVTNKVQQTVSNTLTGRLQRSVVTNKEQSAVSNTDNPESDSKPRGTAGKIGLTGKRPVPENLHVSSIYIDGITWFYILENNEAVIWKGQSGDACPPAVQPNPIGQLIVPGFINGYKVVAIGDCAFSNCDKMTEVILPDSVNAIHHRAFYNCTALTSVKLSPKLEIIAAGTFDRCHALTEIDIGACRELDGGGLVFGDCRSLARVHATGNTRYGERDGALYDDHFRVLVFYPRTLETFDIPSTVETIGPGACWACRRLRTVRLPINVKKVERYAFCLCDFPEFYSEGVRDVGLSAFRGNGHITRATFPASLRRISDRPFERCPQLREVVFLGNAPTFNYSNGSVFGGAAQSLEVVVQRGSKGWKHWNSEELPKVWPPQDEGNARLIRYAD